MNHINSSCSPGNETDTGSHKTDRPETPAGLTPYASLPSQLDTVWDMHSGS